MTAEERKAYMKRYYAENKENFQVYRKMYYRRHRTAINARRRTRYATDAEYRQRDIDRHHRKESGND